MQKYLKQGKYTYNEDDLLGEGSFGKVYRGTNNYSNRQVALKQIELSKLQKGEQMLKTILLSQITVMRKFNKKMEQDPCPFLVRQQDVFRTDKHIFIVMQICCGGTLEDQIRGKRFKQKQCIEVLYCICKGLEYMAQMSIVHRDLKPQNIFISSVKVGKGQGKQTKIYKIGDFGFAAQKQQFQIAMGTFPYMAPQMFKKQKYNNKVDVWSLGVIAYEILFGGLYFVGKDRFQIQKNIKDKPFILSQKEKSKASSNYQDFMIRCLNKDPKYRIQVQKLLSHPLFYEIQKELAEAQVTIYNNQKKEGQIQMKKQISEESKFSDRVFEEIVKPVQVIVKPEQQMRVQKNNSEQRIESADVKTAGFGKLYHLLQQMTKMRIMAEKFRELQLKKRRCTEFIQVYLLKDTCAIMNKLIYTILHRQNYIQFQQSEFREILREQNANSFAQFSESCSKEYNVVSALYADKYKWFINQYIRKYDAEEQQLIKKIVNEDPYELVNPQIFEKQLKKWKFVLEQDCQTKANRFKQWYTLATECNRILEMKLNG